MSTHQVENLELRALEERNRIHRTASELKTKIAEVRGKMGLAYNVKRHMVAGGLIAGIFGLASGYSFAGIFTNK